MLQHYFATFFFLSLQPSQYGIVELSLAGNIRSQIEMKKEGMGPFYVPCDGVSWIVLNDG
jgi:hypothetical protein